MAKSKQKLLSERNTATMRKRILTAARKHFGERFGFDAQFEHGHWWLLRTNGAQYDVVDATGPGSTEGFDFEEVTPPSEE